MLQNTRNFTMVGWGDWQPSRDPESILRTECLTSCIGVAIHNPLTQAGYLAHVYPSVEDQLKTLVPMLEALRSQEADQTRLMAWVGGGSPLRERDLTGKQSMLRELTLGRLAGIGIQEEQIEVEWNIIPASVVSMTLDCKSGGCSLEYEDYSRALIGYNALRQFSQTRQLNQAA